MASPGDIEITRLLLEARGGNHLSAERLMELVYGDLRRMARRQMADERPEHTLQPTALVHEVYLRVFGATTPDWQNRGHFYSVMAQQMRRVLIDHGREFRAAKRGQGLRVALDAELAGGTAQDCDAAVVEELLGRLQKADPVSARIVQLKFFSGLTDQEVARLMGVSHATVRRRWQFARAWFLSRLGRQEKPG